MNYENNEVIETDADTAEEEQDGSLYPYDPTKADIDIREDPQTVFELMRKYKKETLIISPDFQRNPSIWKSEQKSKFIESIILNFPLPPLYVKQTQTAEYIIVDGLQRTITLCQFLNDEFKLTGLEALPKLNGYDFSALDELEGHFQTRIEDKKLNLYVIKPSVPMKVVYDIFNRINTGGTKLERQEVRNCIFLGKSTELLNELAKTDYFNKAIDEGISHLRMKDREVILRYLAFKIFNYKTDYQNMSDLLEKTMKKINLMDDKEIEGLKQDFERVMKLTLDFFGKNNFRLPTKNSRGRINIALFESIAYFFSIQSDDFLTNCRESILKHYEELLNDKEYLGAIQGSTGVKRQVITRFEQVQKILGQPC